MSELVLHPRTQANLQSVAASMPQGLLLVGGQGVGLHSAAQYIARLHTDTINNIATIMPDDKGTISIDTVRQLYATTRSQSSGKRVIIIDDVDSMGDQAQNAFLKLLEEPSANTHFVLTSHDPEKLLATIHSRLQKLQLLPITQQQSSAHIANLGVRDQQQEQQLLFMANGLPAEIARLVSDQELFDQRKKIMSDAKQLINASPYQKLVLCYRYGSDRINARQLLGYAIKILIFTLKRSSNDALVRQLDCYHSAYQKIRSNGHVRLQLLQAVLSSS